MSNIEKRKPMELVKQQQELEVVASPIVRLTDQAQVAIDSVMAKREGFLQRFFPDAATRAVIRGELALIKDEFEFRKRALEKVRETQIQSLTEHCNQYLVREKAAIRSATAAFLLEKKLELDNNLSSLFEEFIARMEVQMAQVETIQNPTLKRGRQSQLEKTIEDFFDLQNRLVDDFQKIISEGV
ncbi:MAG: hypothetical protein JGK04_22950 [Microcoleus sp. PH2017_39_LGB_O_B]|uniref:hypothetical protein n=1 Tax=unclassified Microcoleus TaxID=2642155 RepID=UPI001DBC215F|nr:MULTISPECIES: hypothetical protein [unclassified Microcoleus]MCC3450318.1 hypothetical protein [Microcoleus sp. PH2017_09_SFU_O_A]MCC3631199.1 hypothetical protein [Microcoleus sp. PH2017_39_LGB_O_B]MCC3643410.1 hypothetical protein [Microcoleus sp. PH2017_33_LGB_O_A]TAF87280.1 MAG: hypothetical protein EAZ49_20615 [Oscillatoriales cyanobacterium]